MERGGETERDRGERDSEGRDRIVRVRASGGFGGLGAWGLPKPQKYVEQLPLWLLLWLNGDYFAYFRG